MGLFSGRSDQEIWDRFNAFEMMYNEVTALMNSSVGLAQMGDAAIRAHIAQSRAMAGRVRQEYAVLSNLAQRARDRELKASNQSALKDIQEIISMLDNNARTWEAVLGDGR